MTGAEKAWRVLEDLGVTVVFGIPGGAILPLVDAMSRSPVELVVTRNESAAAHAADGYARATGRVGVCLATSGPGGTNILTGLATAMADSAPIVALVGQVPMPLIGTDAFQETDIFGLSLGLTKQSFRVTDPNDVERILREAFAVAQEGRPGPVLVELPKDIQTATVTEDRYEPAPRPRSPRPGPLDWARVRRLMRTSRRPVVYIGGGVVASGTAPWVIRLAERLNAPIVSTLMGIGSVPSDHPLYLGMLGMHGTWTANHAVSACDLLLALGARFDDRVTGKVSAFAPHARIVHAEVDRAEIGKIVRPDVTLHGDLRTVLPRLAREAPIRRHPAWWRQLETWKAEHPLRVPEPADGVGIPSPRVMQALGEVLAPTDIVTTEVGQHQMWAALFLPRSRPRTFLTSGGTGTMGYGFPAAIGAAWAGEGRRVVAIMGDGSFQMNLQELATVAQYRIPLLMVVMNNAGHGMVRQWQDLFFGGRRHGIDLANPDFVKLAEAFGIPGHRATTPAELERALDAWRTTDGPRLVDVVIPVTEPVFPMVPAGEPLTAVREA
ncbi:MAG: biosynthetic-type acetolactate synthase large subunit [Actinomycetia bacterium]|nr:biosynthetic-type acetolactate synthase large subunit [Actinomycetes bacterium]